MRMSWQNDTRLRDSPRERELEYLRYISNDVARYAKYRGSVSLDLRRKPCSVLAIVTISATSSIDYVVRTTRVGMHVVGVCA